MTQNGLTQLLITMASLLLSGAIFICFKQIMIKIRLVILKRKLITLFVAVLLLLICKYFYINRLHEHSTYNDAPTLLWWHGMPYNYTAHRFCDTKICKFTNDRQSLANAQAVLFYASNMDRSDWPLPRQTQQLWALLHEESPVNVVYLPHDCILRHFNYTATISRYSNFPLTTHHLQSLQQLTSPKYMLPVGEKTRLRKLQKLAPIAFLQTNCYAMSVREIYVQQLMQHIDIDSYGKCLNNRELPSSLKNDYLNDLYKPELLNFLGRYKFILAFENGICEDYITEKFWRPLIIGSIPIYFGAPSIKDWQPNLKSIINIADFDSPKALADFVLQLDANDTEYNNYLNHKYEQLQPIDNTRLTKTLAEREFPKGWENNLFQSFECYMCQQLHQHQLSRTMQWANKSHYNCALPLIFPKMPQKIATANDWQSMMQIGQYEAQLLDELLVKNVNFTQQQLQQMLHQQIGVH